MLSSKGPKREPCPSSVKISVLSLDALLTRGGSRTAATPKVELFVIIVNGWKPLTIITESSTLDIAAVLDPSLLTLVLWNLLYRKLFINVRELLEKP